MSDELKYTVGSIVFSPHPKVNEPFEPFPEHIDNDFTISYMDVNARLQAENERLRSALQAIIDTQSNSMKPDSEVAYDIATMAETVLNYEPKAMVTELTKVDSNEQITRCLCTAGRNR